MGSTTKNGRTRSRRIPGINSPPGTNPILLIAIVTGTPIGHRVTCQCMTPDGAAFSSGFLVLGDTLTVYRQATFQYEDWAIETPLDQLRFDLVADNDIAAGEVFVITSWQQSVRGPNGEWLSAQAVTVPVP